MASEQALREAFDLHDHQGEKSIGAAELGNALRSVGRRLTNESVGTLEQKATAELGGKLSFDDFKRYYGLAGEVEKRDEDLKEAFAVFDNGKGTGMVDVASLRHALVSLGDRLSHEQVNTILSDAGVGDADHSITFERFLKLVNVNVAI